MTLPAGLLAKPLAHRGLWQPGGAPENSLAAFAAARAAGYGIELDVRLSADNEAIVFHDETVDRLTGQSGAVAGRTADDLTRLELLGSDQTIPTLQQALAVIGDAPVLVELKTPPGQEGRLERRVADLLNAHTGPKGLLSFNSSALAWMAAHAPDLLRGLNCLSAEALAETQTARADFISVSLPLAGHPQVQAWRRDSHAAGWTARSPAEAEDVTGMIDLLMFEGWRP